MTSIRKINASLEHHTVVVQDLDNWLIYQDNNGQLIGWISSTTLKTFDVCFLGSGTNRLLIMRAFRSYQEALDLLIGGA